MKVIILCGGLGTRLREETEYRPKPLVAVGGHPILWHIMKLYAHHGFKDFVLCLGYRGDMIKDYFLNYEAMNNDFTICLGSQDRMTFHGTHAEQDFCVTLANTGLDTMTGGRIKRVQQYVDEHTFMVTYGDGVADVDMGALLAFHNAHGRLATVTAVHPVSQFGILEVAGDGKIATFAEKPRSDGWASAGFFVFNQRIVDYLAGDECILEREPMERLVRDGQLMGYRHEGFFCAMDTYRDSLRLNQMWASGEAPWKVWE